MSLTGLPQSTIILSATATFCAVAWTAGVPAEPEQKCEGQIRQIQYLPQIEPSPIIIAPPLGWPVLDRARADDAEPIVAKEETVADEPAPVHHRHRRHWRRR